MPPDTESDARTSAPRAWAPPEPHLFVVLEGDRPLAGGCRVALRDVDDVRIGRTDSPHIVWERSGRRLVLGLPDRKVSTEHARLLRGERSWRAEDLGSTNGSFIEARRFTTEALAEGALLELGRTLLRFRGALPTPSGSADVVVGSDASTSGLAITTLLPALAGELNVVGRMSASMVPVLLLGETGSGKEVIARAIHDASGRHGPFVPVNCAALPDTLVESQLFGHVKGAFSGALRDEPGFVRSAAGGTLFLDEIGDLPRAAQGVLLRVLQESEVVPVGASRAVRVDVRVICATHQPIDDMIARGEFRKDLFARLQGFTHRVPPLRDRREDLGVLVASLLPRLAKVAAADVRFSSEAARALVHHTWPLNVRELAQSLARALALAPSGHIGLEHLGPTLTAVGTSGAPVVTAPIATHGEDVALRRELAENLARFDGNVTAVAREMNKAPMQVYRWMRRLGLDPRGYR